MKRNERHIARRIAAVILLALFGLSSCELFLVPKRARDNPNDPDNPVQPAVNFQAVGVSDSSISLSFEAPSPDDPAKIPAGYVIVRGEGEPPGWIDQGTTVRVEPAANFEAGMTYTLLDDDPSLVPGKEYWYALWVHGDGELENHYTHSGTNSAITESPPSFTRLNPANGEFRAFGISDNAARVEWYYPDGSFPPPAHYVVRKEGTTAPADANDGKGFPVQWDWWIEDWGLEKDMQYTYAIFPADQDGSPYPTTAAAVWDGATTMRATKPLNPTADGYVDNTGGVLGSAAYPSMTINAANTAIGLVDFDPTVITDFGYLIQARLILTLSALRTSGDIEVERIQPGMFWDESSSLISSDVQNGYLAVDGFAPIVTVAGAGGTQLTWDVTGLVWKAIESDISQFSGFALLPTTGSGVDVDLATREGTANPPVLEIEYYID